MKKKLKIERGRIRPMLTYIFSKAYNNLLLMTFILILIYFSGCSDEISTINSDQSLTTIDGEAMSLKAAVQPQTLMVWGDDTWGQISNAPAGKFKVVSGGSINGLALRWDKTPVLWGAGPIGPPPIPEALASEKFQAITIGRDDAVLIRQNQTLAAFGRNDVVTNVPSGYYHAVAVAVVHAVAIADDGTLKTWGSDSYFSPNGFLTGLLNAPKGSPFIAVDARTLYSLALHEDGTLYGWGHANFLFGWTPTPEDQRIFYIPDQKFKAVAA
ncbi:MAG: hypothetical protein Q8P34_09450, partial [Bacteroidota bacterium]|nr:hypothetical protein [Bacteroidota bacterium]